MKDYHLHLVGLRTVLRAPHAIILSQRLTPFLCPPHDEVDCTITVQPMDVLPPFAEGGVWHGLEYYDCLDGVERIFHCHAPYADAFAVTCMEVSGNVTIGVLPAYLSYFEGSSGIFNRIGLETLLLRHRGVLLHASLIEYNDKAIAFVGPSGVGKSTQADLWRTHVGARILNGDRAALRQTADGWTAYGSPYAGSSGIYCDASAPLRGVVVLQQGQENRLTPLSVEKAFRCVYPETAIHHWDARFVTDATDLCLTLLAQVPVFMLECLPNEDAVRTLQKGLAL